MNDKTQSPLQHRQVQADGLALHVVEGGVGQELSIVFLHGWPQDWSAFERVMQSLSSQAHVVALDLPGIGGSTTAPALNDKRSLAKHIRALIRALGLRRVVLVGHDAGGMIVYAYLRAFPDDLERAVIMNTVIPGLDPWSKVRSNPQVWHFGFHAVAELPEQLVAGRQARYFAFFYDVLSASAGGVSASQRAKYVAAYARLEALRTGFDWYRAFPRDEKDNAPEQNNAVRTPVLYLRGTDESGDIDEYVAGLRAGSLIDVRGRSIEHCGHFSADERPDEVSAALREFLELAPLETRRAVNRR